MNTLKKVYQLSINLRNLKPWTFLSENDIFGIQIPGSEKKYFVSIMGGAGEHYALAAYEGTHAILDFWELSQPDTWYRPEDLLTIPHLMVSFENKEEIEPAARKQLREFGFNFMGKNAWPDLKHVKPGFVPEMPEEEALADLVMILEQTMHVVNRAKISPDFILPETMDEDMYLMRTNTSPGKDDWKDTYWKLELPSIPYTIEFSTFDKKKIRGLKRTNYTIQADIAITNKVIASPGQKPYFACMFIMIHKQTQMVLDFELLSPTDGIHKMYAKFPQLLIDKILRLKWRPAVIEFRHPLLHEMAQEVLYSTNIKIIYHQKLNLVDDFLKSFTEADLQDGF